MGTCALATVSAERLLALLIIKLKPPHLSWHFTVGPLRCERWSGHRLACPVGLLGGRCDCRLFADRTRVFPSPPTAIEQISFQTMLFTTCCCLPSSPLSPADWMFPWVTGDRPSKRVREAVCSVCVFSLFVGLPLHHPPQQLHRPSRQPSMFQQPMVTVTSETIIEKNHF